MTLEQIKEEVAAMPVDHQRQLAAYLVYLRHSRDPETKVDLTRQIDDRDPARWVSVEQLKDRWKE